MVKKAMRAPISAENPGTEHTLQVGCPTAVTDTEEGRAFLQKRLSIFGLCLFALSGTSWAIMALAYLVLRPEGLEGHGPFSLGGSLHLMHSVFAGALWLATRNGQRRGPVLHVLDVGVMLGLILVWAMLGVTLPDAR